MILRLSFPVLSVGLAAIGAERDRGLFNNFAVPDWVEVLVSALLLDLAIYLQHVMFHAVPGLWRLHRMHHAEEAIEMKHLILPNDPPCGTGRGAMPQNSSRGGTICCTIPTRRR